MLRKTQWTPEERSKLRPTDSRCYLEELGRYVVHHKDAGGKMDTFDAIGDEIAALRLSWPGTVMCLTRRTIEELGGFQEAKRKLAPSLNFSHAWIHDPTTDNIIIGRLPEHPDWPGLMSVIEAKARQDWEAQVLPPDIVHVEAKPEKKPSILDITRSMC